MKLTSLSLVTGIAVSGIVASGSFTPAQASRLITTQTGYTGPTLDLSDYANGQNNYTTGPSDLRPIPGGITFSSTAPDGSTLGQNSSDQGYLLSFSVDDADNGNGIIDRTPVFAGLESSTGEMIFVFDTPVQQFGAFLNYAPNDLINPPIISAFNSSGALIKSFNLKTDGGAISTPGGVNQFAFRGIDAETDRISRFTLGGSSIVASGRDYPSASTAVPEPFTIIGTIVGGSAALRMRKKLKSTKA